MPIKDALEMFMNIFHGNGTPFMKDASHFDPKVGVRIASILGRHEQAIRLVTGLVQVQGYCNGDHPTRNGLRRELLATGQEQAHCRRH